ncbi:MAG TPA: M56 family metallopeptidase [Bryobacteraceae bacterium]|nr:M56 family metallopeptidase [Bryobacteraceae bacterium]
MNFLVGSTYIVGAAWIAAALARGASADLRSRIWRAALAALALVWLPWPPPEAVRISVSAGLGDAAGGFARVPGSSWLVWVWAAGAALLLARWAVGLIRLARLTRAARPLEANIRVSDAAATPMTWGVLRPVILLPAAALAWPAEERARALRHERAHIERRDWPWQLFAQLATAACWFHPLVWLAAYQLRRESELAADDAVLREGSDASAYAAQLVDVARAARRLRGETPLAAVAMVRPSTLEARIAAILSRGRNRGRAGVRARLAVVLAAALVLVPVSVLEAAKTHRVGEPGLTPPKLASKTDPQYTEEARAAKIQGTTVLSLVVNEKGLAEKVQVKKSLNKGLDAKAVLAVKQWHFEPGTLNGKPVRVAAVIEVNFRLL